MKNHSATSISLRMPIMMGCLMFGAFIMTTMITQVRADDDHGQGRQGQQNHQNNGRQHRGHYRDRDWEAHQGHAQRYWNQPYFEPEPSVVYAPPVIYSPPPVYEEPGISLIFPLHIR